MPDDKISAAISCIDDHRPWAASTLLEAADTLAAEVIRLRERYHWLEQEMDAVDKENDRLRGEIASLESRLLEEAPTDE